MKIPSLKEVKDLGYMGVDFYLSKSCNKSCYYCTAWTLEMRNLDVDMDFLRHTLNCLAPYKTKINLLGGEPGLIKNLDEVIAEIRKYPNFIVSVLSNSFVRKRYPHILEDPEIYYVEHLVLDFHEDRIEKLGNHPFIPANDLNNYNLIIKTPNYFKYKDNHPEVLEKLNHKNTMWKAFNGRSPEFTDVIQAEEIDRKMCAAFPQVPVIDFEKRHIVHCSKKFANNKELSKTFDLTQENIDKMMNWQLFKYENYCKTCTEWVPPKGHFPFRKYAKVLNA